MIHFILPKVLLNDVIGNGELALIFPSLVDFGVDWEWFRVHSVIAIRIAVGLQWSCRGSIL